MAELPPMHVVADTLRRVTETLALELSQSRTEAPSWGRFEWRVASSAAAMQGISAVLAGTLRWSGPAEWQEFLEREARETAQRDARVGEVLARIDVAARKHSVAVVGLKGAALRAIALWPLPQRPLADIDLLVRPPDVAGLGHALEEVGYEHSFTSRRNIVFMPRGSSIASGFGERALNPIPIEVHTQIAERLPATLVDITQRLWPVNPVPGVNAYASQAELLRHLLLHCSGNMRGHALRLIQLCDLGRLAQRLAPEDWSELFGDAECWWPYPVLRMSERYFPGRIPAEVLEEARRRCPPWLRWASGRHDLTDVSWSNLRIEALPGVEWARTPLELARYVRRRAIPDRAVFNELEHLQQSMPQLGAFSWYRQRHLARILRWVFTRPPRLETITSVMAALDSEQPARGLEG